MTRHYPNTNPTAWITIALFLLALLLSSCSKQYYINKYCPKVKDSVRVEIITKDSLVRKDSLIKVPGEIITVTDTLPCPDMKYEKKGKKGSIKVEIKDSVMTAECIIDTTEIAFDWIEHHKKEIMNTYREQVFQVTVKAPKTGFQKLKDWVFWLFVAYVIFRITRWILKRTGYWPFPIQIKRSG